MSEGTFSEKAAILGEAVPREAQQRILDNVFCTRCRGSVRITEFTGEERNCDVVLSGKCANCATRIPLRYPLTELATGLMTLALAWHFGVSPALLGAMLLTWSLIALAVIDIDHQLLPDDITLPLLWLGLLFNLGGTYVSLQDAVIGAMGGYLILWSVYWLFKLVTGKEGMGYGDFKLLAALGAWLGWQALPLIILLSSLVGAVCGIALMVIKRRGREIPIPFGPYLAMAGWISLLWGDLITNTYLGGMGLE